MAVATQPTQFSHVIVSPSTPRPSLAALTSADPASLIAVAADVALLLDATGVIRDVKVANDNLAGLDSAAWIGLHWVETVTEESRPKVEALLKGGKRSGKSWRHVNHASSNGPDVPVLYATMPAGPPGHMLAIGRDLRQLADVQQRLIAAQQSLERDYLRLRQLEARHRLMFQSVPDPLLIVDAGNGRVLEANTVAGELTGLTLRRLLTRSLPDLFDAGSQARLQGLVQAALRGSNQHGRLHLAASGNAVLVSLAGLRQDNQNLLLVRIAAETRGRGDVADASRERALAALAGAPDAIVITDSSGRVLQANDSFARLVQVDSPARLTGESIDRWLGRSSLDVGVLLSTLRNRESVRAFPSVVRAANGSETLVEIAAHGSASSGDAGELIAFFIRDVERRPPAVGERNGTNGLRPSQEFTDLVGRMPLKDIVSATTDVIEQLCIEAALKLTRDNRAAAAEMLGLSRQSLYVKMRRFGVRDHGFDDEH